MKTENRAYSVLEIKSVDDERRILEGIASTPTPDRMNDIVDLRGMEFKLPLPFLYQHNSRQPIGQVIDAKKTKEGLKIKAQIAKDLDIDFIDEAWKLIKSGLIRGLSIGFRPTEEPGYDKETGGFIFSNTELFEISAVTIPANAEASILSVKSADAAALSLSGRNGAGFVRLTDQKRLGVPGTTHKGNNMAKKSIAEQIVEFSNLRAQKQARVDELVELASDGARTMSVEEKEEREKLRNEIKEIDEHISILQDHERDIIARAGTASDAVAKTAANGQQQQQAVARRPIEVKSMAPKGIVPARMAIAMYKAGNVPDIAVQIAKRLWPDSPEVELILRAAVDAGDTTTSGWASQLVPAAQQLMNEFLELLRPATIIGRIPGLRQVPFNIAIPIETAGGTVNWIGEGAGKPVGALTFTSATLRWAKAAGIVVITEELARFSQPSAEMIIRDSMIKTLTRFFDTQFVSTNAEVSNVSPAGILNGISATTPSGTTAAALRVDLATLIGKFITNNQDPTNLVLLMSATQAMKLGLITTDLGMKLFPSIGITGGTLEGFPVVVSENVGTKIIALNASEILIAQDNGIRVDVSREASIEMESTPAVGEQSPITTLGPLKSLWQNNLVGFRVEQYITWKAARTSAVEYLNGTAYGVA